MWLKIVLVFSWTLVVYSQHYDDLGIVGNRILASASAPVAPLEDSSQSMHPDFRSRRSSESDDLHERQAALSLNQNMRDGVGGVTVVTYTPSGRHFLIKNYQGYICNFDMDIATGHCPDLTPIELTGHSNCTAWCYIQSHSLINSHLCLAAGELEVDIINGTVNYCRTTDKTHVVEIGLDDYKLLCTNVRERAEFRYIPDLGDRKHVDIPNENKYVKCENQQKNLCIFHEKNPILRLYDQSKLPNGPRLFIHNSGTIKASFHIH